MAKTPRGQWHLSDSRNWYTKTMGWFPDNDRVDASFNPQPEVTVTTSVDTFGDPTIEIRRGDNAILINDIEAFFVQMRHGNLSQPEPEPEPAAPALLRVISATDLTRDAIPNVLLAMYDDGTIRWRGTL